MTIAVNYVVNTTTHYQNKTITMAFKLTSQLCAELKLRIF